MPIPRLQFKAREQSGSFDLKRAIKNPKNKFNYLLQEGDIMSIPKTLDYVLLPNTDTLQNNRS